MSEIPSPSSAPSSVPAQQKDFGEYVATRQKIGNGSFAVVYKGYKKSTKEDIAVKVVTRKALSKKLLENLEAEIEILKALKHPNIVHLFDILKTEKHIFLFLELCAGGDLSHSMKKRGKPMSEDEALFYFRQLVSGLHFLHTRNLAHRDLKPQNLLLASDQPGATLKIADFGFARYIKPQSMVMTMCGSPLYMAPEILRMLPYDAKADLWSVGVILYEMVCGHTPFTGMNPMDLLRNIQASEVSFPHEVNQRLSPPFVDLVKRLLQKAPEARMGFSDLFEHPIVKGPGPFSHMISSPRLPPSSSAATTSLSSGPSTTPRLGSYTTPPPTPPSLSAATTPPLVTAFPTAGGGTAHQQHKTTVGGQLISTPSAQQNLTSSPVSSPQHGIKQIPISVNTTTSNNGGTPHMTPLGSPSSGTSTQSTAHHRRPSSEGKSSLPPTHPSPRGATSTTTTSQKVSASPEDRTLVSAVPTSRPLTARQTPSPPFGGLLYPKEKESQKVGTQLPPPQTSATAPFSVVKMNTGEIARHKPSSALTNLLEKQQGGSETSNVVFGNPSPPPFLPLGPARLPGLGRKEMPNMNSILSSEYVIIDNQEIPPQPPSDGGAGAQAVSLLQRLQSFTITESAHVVYRAVIFDFSHLPCDPSCTEQVEQVEGMAQRAYAISELAETKLKCRQLADALILYTYVVDALSQVAYVARENVPPCPRLDALLEWVRLHFLTFFDRVDGLKEEVDPSGFKGRPEQLMFDYALSLAKEAAGEEIMGNFGNSAIVYSRALLVLEQISNSLHIQNLDLLAHYWQDIKQRLEIVSAKLSAVSGEVCLDPTTPAAAPTAI